MGQIDIIARLQLNAQQFSSESGRAAADITGKMTKAAGEIRQPFVSAFAEVQKIASTALTAPRSASGSLDLSAEIAQLNQAASASDQHAIGLRELSIAQNAAANAARGDAQALRLEADASAVAAIAAEREAEATRDRIVMLEAVQRELNTTTSATVLHSKAGQGYVTSAEQQRQSTMMLGQQLQDFTVQVSSGQSITTAFSQQIGQASFALTGMGGVLGKVGGFLATGWGTAVLVAVTAIGPLLSKLLDTNHAAEETQKALAAAASAADSFGNAESLLGKVIDLTTGKLKTHNEVLIQTIRLTAQSNLAQANAKIKAAGDQFGLNNIVLKAPTAGAGGVGGLGAGDIDAAVKGQGQIDAQQRQIDIATRGLLNLINNDAKAKADPSAYTKSIGDALKFASARLDSIAVKGKIAGQSLTDVQQKLAGLATVGNDKAAALMSISVVNGGKVPDELTPYAKDKKARAPKKTPDLTRESESAAETIARINAEWDQQPKLIDKANVETLKLTNLISDLERRKPPGFEKLIADAREAKVHIQEGLDRPYQDFIRHQQEGLAVQRLQLQGRDAEADALQTALRLQDQQGPLDAAHLAELLAAARQQEAITRQIENQRQIIGLYQTGLSDVRRTFDGFAADLQGGNIAAGVKDLFGGLVSDFQALERNLLSNSLFGGVDQAIDKYIRSLTGQRTPAEIVSDQATESAKALSAGVTGQVSALDVLTKAYRSAASQFGGSASNDNGKADPALLTLLAKGNGVAGAPGSLMDMLSKGNGVTGPNPDGSADIVVMGNLDRVSATLVKASGVFGAGFDRFTHNLDALGVHLPASITGALKKELPDVLAGAATGQMAGGAFAAISGGKNDPLASGIGGALGEKVGKSLEKPLGDIFGKTLGGFAGPLGGVLGGVLGNVLGGLFNNPKFGTASVSLNQYGDVTGGTGTGNSNNAAVAATGLASSVASGINAIADQLGGKISNLAAVTVGDFDGKYRVAQTNTTESLNYNNFNSSVLKDFGQDQQAAIEYAVKYALSTSVINGVSQASQNIIKSGQDLSVSIQKALLIEQVPKDLKAALDPVGAAIDDLNRKWGKTVDALKEGGATTEQMTQAERLYKIQLDEVKNSTDSASQTLKDFQKSLKLGSDSPYSLRDQEGTAMAALKPFLDQIAGGQAIDQSKYQEAAKAYLDVERSLYGSTDKYFAALDSVQASTNAAISTIDNAVPITTAVADPFVQATAASAAATADGVQTGNEIASDTNALLAQIASLMAQVATNTGTTTGSAFIGADRAFLSAAA